MGLDDQQASDERSGGDLLARISTAMSQAQKKYFGLGPLSTKSYMLDDFLIIVMRGSQTVAEKTMLDFGQADVVRSFRQAFENEMTGKLTDMIEELTGRKVLGYQSQILFEPEAVVEMFFFDRTVPGPAISATAEGQLAESGVGEARSEQEDVAGRIPAD